MTNRNTDKISMLVDGELGDWEMSQVVQTLKQDAELQACWRNYHLIGDAMRGSLPKHVHADLTDRISSALEHEPSYLAPRTSPAPAAPPGHDRSKATIGFALAASLTAIAVVGVLGVDHGGPAPAMVASSGPAVQAPQTQGSVQALTPLFAGLATNDTAPEPLRRSGIQTVSAGAGALPDSPDLYEYLMNYHQYAVRSDRDDPLSYLRMVSHASAQ